MMAVLSPSNVAPLRIAHFSVDDGLNACPICLRRLLENPGIPLLFRIQTVSLKVLDLKFKVLDEIN
jgi:hypothetical protein